MIQTILYRYWSPMAALVLAGILSAVYFGLTGSVWAVTGEFTRLGGQFLHLFNVDTSDWSYFNIVKIQGNTLNRADGWMVWGMFLGALIMVLLNQSFKLRAPLQRRRWLQALGGGVIAGFGARLAMGCNLAAFFTGVPQFSFHSWIFIVTTALGSYLATLIVRQSWWRGKPNRQKRPNKVINTAWQPVAAIILFVAIILGTVYFLVQGLVLLALGLIFGMLFGVLLERGQICFTSALRDLWLFNSTTMLKAIIAGMAVSSAITFIFIANGSPAITQITAFSTAVGGVLFGLGIVLASACETGMMYRMMEGQLVYIVAFIGNIIGATVLAYGWDHWYIEQSLAAGATKINLAITAGPALALLYTLIFLALLYVAVRFKEKINFLTAIRTHA